MKNYSKCMLVLLMLSFYNIVYCQVPQVNVNWGFNGFLKSPKEYVFEDFDVMDDGRIVCIGRDAIGSWDNPNNIDTTKIICYDINGEIDNTFNIFYFTNEHDNSGYTRLLEPKKILYYQNYIYVFTYDQYDIDFPFSTRILVTKLDINGNTVNQFGQNGTLYIENYHPQTEINFINAYIHNGEISMLTYEYSNTTRNLVLKKYDTNSNIVISFGNNGVADIPVIYNNNEYDCTDFMIDIDKYVITGISEGNYFVGRLDYNTGNFDTSFGINGSINISAGTLFDSPYNIFKMGANYYMVGVDDEDELIQCASVTDNGDFNYGFNNLGYLYPIENEFAEGGSNTSYLKKYISAKQNNNKFIVIGQDFTYNYMVYKLLRLNEDGSKDISFGSNGSITLDFGSDFIFKGSGIKLWQNKIYVLGKSADFDNSDRGSGTVLSLNNDYTNKILNYPKTSIKVFPNPTSDLINLSQTAKQVSIYDIYGNLINTFTNINQISTRSYEAGIYFIYIIENSGTTSNFKLLKLH